MDFKNSIYEALHSELNQFHRTFKSFSGAPRIRTNNMLSKMLENHLHIQLSVLESIYVGTFELKVFEEYQDNFVKLVKFVHQEIETIPDTTAGKLIEISFRDIEIRYERLVVIFNLRLSDLDSAVNILDLVKSASLELDGFSLRKNSIDNELQGFSNDFQTLIQQVNDYEGVLESKLSEVENDIKAKKSQITSALELFMTQVGVSAGEVIAADYAEVSVKERSIANWFRGGAIALMLLAVFVATDPFTFNVFYKPFQANDYVLRAFSVLALTLFATYLAKQSSIHRQEEHLYRRLSVDKVAVPSYLTQMQPSTRERVLEHLATHYFFGNPGQTILGMGSKEQSDDLVDKVSKAVLESLTKNAAKGQ